MRRGLSAPVGSGPSWIMTIFTPVRSCWGICNNTVLSVMGKLHVTARSRARPVHPKFVSYLPPRPGLASELLTQFTQDKIPMCLYPCLEYLNSRKPVLLSIHIKLGMLCLSVSGRQPVPPAIKHRCLPGIGEMSSQTNPGA